MITIEQNTHIYIYLLAMNVAKHGIDRVYIIWKEGMVMTHKHIPGAELGIG